MKKIVLSDHTSDCIAAKELEREKQYQSDLAEWQEKCKDISAAHEIKVKEYETALKERRGHLETLKAKRSEAWQQKAIWQFIMLIVKIMVYSWSHMPERPRGPYLPHQPWKQDVSEQEHIWAVGREGEIKVSEYLATQLDDSWYEISGYKNWKGEIDKVLVGPDGIFAIEIKNINGKIYCDGDGWIKDKYDKYGNAVELGLPIEDRKGRSPSQQVNEAADMLQAYLQKFWPGCRIYRLILATHECSRIGGINELTVDEFCLFDGWTVGETLRRSRFKLSLPDVAKAINKIEGDHKYQEKNTSFKNPRRKPRKTANVG